MPLIFVHPGPKVLQALARSCGSYLGIVTSPLGPHQLLRKKQAPKGAIGNYFYSPMPQAALPQPFERAAVK
jgi:hypothetical protein